MAQEKLEDNVLGESEQEIAGTGASLEELLDNDVVIDQGSDTDQQNGNYRKIYAGTTLNNQGLYQLSSRERIRFIVVAGPHGSGKTTLETIFYYLFQKGLNERVSFAGSQTILGYTKRSSGLKVDSGKMEAQMQRTSRSTEEAYLHLAVVKEQTGQKENLIFLDLAGETFMSTENLTDREEMLAGADTVMVLLDGEKLCDAASKNSVFSNTNTIIRLLLKHKVLSEDTNLHLVCTKQDKIEACDEKQVIYDLLEEQKKNLEKNFSSYVKEMDFTILSALDFEHEYGKLEDLLVKCMEKRGALPVAENERRSKPSERHFDRFHMRG